MKQEEIVTPDKNSDKGKKVQVQEMFDTISSSYDGLNRVMTLRMDISWRKHVREKVFQIKPGTILDVATGTGDLAIELSKIPKAHIIAVDISQGMLSVGEKKVKELNLSDRITMQVADSENLPFADESFDAVTVSFGIRNFENLEKGLTEIKRVLRPKGRLVILETSVPTRFPYKQGYKLYTKFIVPLMGKFLAKNQNAYAYLSESAAKFPFGERLSQILSKEIGFSKVIYKPQTLGVATIYIADK
ncbi:MULTISPECIES: bifunctional demethylmenaquinone methyltransferase/2-methoxy-6-polyprenyl-1,4-benzoquinol methylase UbiE [unclassified Capnocytophaga]|jgi:ribosomal protein L11 methyltransferase (prmA)|uniref:bifunctional demethylmenaquinone methyltransferase/2-methoxy-6-polyprenyl-1,4-benzoquinol methylase UbiE n=1 Tax=unclassified Capnocytophaga TaxID=2640652 RepID=UPI000202E93B|nr:MULTISPECIES: bifunctional demethylmenaquinone methyltransferase/2-methoxy-6-polyprenyl-1,4-benzoquinol methylase UbiE [unclassified Capnocytophaga]EGD33082.1 ubiquinone/menaquinone biosynthesis methyltransferase UbiE [Capnocytophaga sp. oral taxon 338 str. F0234]MEB3005545.1 bifunctional demethylmenaquinone methyltransferase/2-methoxy-6-polyprenyl-1,4-benzoquinol methylase UbiE [Capnocytophaga sp. G2]